MYFGSVRFFKNMILLAVIIMITIPACTSFYYKSQYEKILTENKNIITADSMALDRIYHSEDIFSADVPEYQSLYPDFYAPQPLDASEYTENTVYLTFDDGPSARTPEVLNILRREEVKATFFVVGKEDEFSRQTMRNILRQGHTLAMHSYSHVYKDIYSSVEAYLDDMYKIFSLIKEATGTAPTYFRFAGGSINSHNHGVYQEIIAEMLRRGFIPCDWNVSSGDASSTLQSAGTISYNVLSGVEKTSRAVVLMHDSAFKTTTVESLSGIIQALKEHGYSFDRLTPQTKPVLFTYTY